MSIKKKILVAIAALGLSVGTMSLASQVASASTPVNMHLVCQQNMGTTPWGAKLIDSNSVYGWKCWNRAYPEQYWFGPFFDADVNYYCSAVEGTSS